MTLQASTEQQWYTDPVADAANWAPKEEDWGDAPDFPEHVLKQIKAEVSAWEAYDYQSFDDYDAIAGAEDLAADVLQRLRASSHSWTNYDDCHSEDYLVAPEMVIDDLFPVGRIVISGKHSGGKSVTIVPLALLPTGLVSDYPLEASIRRRVVYIAEDVKQVRRVIRAMQEDGVLTRDNEAINQWFIVVPSARLSPDNIAEVADTFRSLSTENERVDGSMHTALPLIVIDTLAANVMVERIEDNTEHSKMHSMFRESFGDMPIWLVTHVVKKATGKQSRNRIQELSAIGGQSLEADANGTAYIFEDNAGRCLCVGKDRVEIGAKVFDIGTKTHSVACKDVLGRDASMIVRYNTIQPVAPEEVRRRIEADQKQHDVIKAIYDAIRDNPGTSYRGIKEKVKGATEDLNTAYKKLISNEEWVENRGTIHRPKWYVVDEDAEYESEPHEIDNMEVGA